MKLQAILKYLSFAFFLGLTGCAGGGSESGSGSDNGGTTYTGTITQVYTPSTTGRQELNTAVATCTYSGNVSVHVNADGSVTITSSNMGGQNSVSCTLLSEIYNASFSGSADGSSYQATASASGPHASMNGQISGTYTATTLTGTGSATVTATTPEGAAVNFSATFSFQANAV